MAEKATYSGNMYHLRTEAKRRNVYVENVAAVKTACSGERRTLGIRKGSARPLIHNRIAQEVVVFGPEVIATPGTTVVA